MTAILPASRVLAAAVLACLLTASTAFAADGEGTRLDLEGGAEGARAVAPGATGGDLVRTIVGLAIVLGVILALHWVLKQIRASRQDGAQGAGLESLATLPLGTNRSLHLVRAGAEVVLVAAGEGGVTPIRTYHETEARALGLLPSASVDVVAAGGSLAPSPAPAECVEAELVGLPGPSREVTTWGAAQPLPAAKRLMDTLRAKTVR